jgi:ABC-type sulfate transport system permease subunit
MVIPLAIDPGVWLAYYTELLLFAERFPQQSMYIHARINLPVHDSPIIRFVIYSLFVYNTPYAMFNLINGISFRILFNYEPGRNGIDCNHLELLPSSGGPPLYGEDDINQMINRVLNT